LGRLQKGRQKSLDYGTGWFENVGNCPDFNVVTFVALPSCTGVHNPAYNSMDSDSCECEASVFINGSGPWRNVVSVVQPLTLELKCLERIPYRCFSHRGSSRKKSRLFFTNCQCERWRSGATCDLLVRKVTLAAACRSSLGLSGRLNKMSNPLFYPDCSVVLIRIIPSSYAMLNAIYPSILPSPEPSEPERRHPPYSENYGDTTWKMNGRKKSTTLGLINISEGACTVDR
jgi:hypothetical protein